MTLINGSFEDGWDTLPSKNQKPHGWKLAWDIPGSKLIAPKAGNGDTETTVLCVPECVHKLSIQLPPNEQLDGDDALILDGETVYKTFGHAAFRATLSQQFRVATGALCNLIIPVQVHGQKKQDGTLYNVDTGAAYWRVTINGTPGPWFTYNNDFSDREWMYYSPGFKAPYGTVDILIEFESHTLAGIDFFIDNVQFSSDAPQPVECPKPRDGWTSRTTVLVHFDAPHKAWTEACEWADADYRRHDVARAWDPGLWSPGLREVNIKCWQDIPGRFPPGLVRDWGKEYYPSINANITDIIAYTEPPPPEPPTNKPKPIVHYSGNFVGLQHYIPKAGWLDYIKIAKPTVTKCFSCGDVIRAKQAQPQMLSVWRKHVDGDGGWLVGDRLANARRLVSLYEAELATTCNNMWLTREDALSYIDVIESLNETVPSNNANHIKAAVEFDVYFSEYVAQVFGGAVKAGIMNVAVGNPLESEVELLLPCARESHEGRAIVGYHSYWSADTTQSYMDENWPYHAGRWQEWDVEFNKHDLYPTYYLGECGICYSYPESHGAQFVPTKGWKSCGNFQNYIQQIKDFNLLLQIWNEWHQGRCFGGTVFIYGHDGWADFSWEPGDLVLLRETMKQYA